MTTPRTPTGPAVVRSVRTPGRRGAWGAELSLSGRGIFLEHVLSGRPVVRQTMKALNPLLRPMMGGNIDRLTRKNIEAAELTIESETDLWLDIVKLFVARP